MFQTQFLGVPDLQVNLGSESALLSGTQTRFGLKEGHEISPSILQLILACHLSQVLLMSLSTGRARFRLLLAQAIKTTWYSHDNSASVDKTAVGLGRSKVMMLTEKSSVNHPGVQLRAMV